MRAVVQRVSQCAVKVEGREHSRIGSGFLIFLGIGRDDTDQDVRYLVDKIVQLRVFEDDAGKMNLSIKDVAGELMVVSQFTLYGDCRKGRRPSFSKAAPPDEAKALYKLFCTTCQEKHDLMVKTGVFQAHMEVELVNDGPVTLLLDSKKVF